MKFHYNAQNVSCVLDKVLYDSDLRNQNFSIKETNTAETLLNHHNYCNCFHHYDYYYNN